MTTTRAKGHVLYQTGVVRPSSMTKSITPVTSPKHNPTVSLMTAFV